MLYMAITFNQVFYYKGFNMSFNNSTFKKTVEKYQGWIEGGIALFPSPYLKDQFLKEMKNIKDSK